MKRDFYWVNLIVSFIMENEQKLSRGKAGRYERLTHQFAALVKKYPDPLANMATLNAILYHKLPEVFWVGFYFLEPDFLRVGPYQGSLACQTLPAGNGVCWAAVNKKEAVIVPNVHEFPGHIACDSRSNSEIVLPLFDSAGSVYAVLDIDSRETARFDEEDAKGLRKLLDCIPR